MGKTLVAFLLGTALVILSYSIFGGGLVSSFFTVTEATTNPNFMTDLATGRIDPGAAVGSIVMFIIDIAIYYIAAAILVFVFDLFMPGKKDEKK